MKPEGRPAPIPFDEIAPRYDFLNHFLSLGIDVYWRKKLVQQLPRGSHLHFLDVATGTADLALMAAQKTGARVTGSDIADRMLDIGRLKTHRNALNNKVTLVNAPAENLPFESGTFDAAMVSFGARNFLNLETGLTEMHRVLRPEAGIWVLEFSLPRQKIIRSLYLFYFTRILPRIGGWLSQNRNAYDYLPASVLKFPEGEAFCSILGKCGFQEVKARPLTLGVATLYTGRKAAERK